MLQSMVSRVRLWACLASVGVGGLCSTTAWAGSVPSSSVWQRVTAEGESYQAIVLRSDELPGAVAPKTHAVLVDTSASQAGEHRQLALKLVAELLKQLPADHRIQLWAVDVSAEPLTAAIVAPNSAEMQAGLKALHQRIPLGATDLAGGLKTVLQALPANQPASVVYIGDGQSGAQTVDGTTLTNLANEYRQRQTSITSYGVGPMLHMQLLGSLAVQTGGNVHTDIYNNSSSKNSEQFVANQAKALARSATGVVSYPQTLNIAPATVAVLPNIALPLRKDRETIYLSTGVLPADVRVSLSAGKTSRTWTLADPEEVRGTAFIPAYTQRAMTDSGLSNGLAGVNFCQLAEDDFQAILSSRLDEGRRAYHEKKHAVAARIAEEVRRIDGDSVEARQLSFVAEQAQFKLASRQETVVEEPQSVNVDTIGELERSTRVKTQKLQYEVSKVVEAARAARELDSAIDALKQTINSVRSATDINPEDRAKMMKQLENELLATENRRDRYIQEQTRRQELIAQQESIKRLQETAILDEERLENLIDRVRALMSAGRHGDHAAYGEAQAVSDVAVNMRPGEGTSAAARFGAEAAEQLDRARRLRARRADQFLETLHQVELSHIPFPDEPPVRYPPAEVWQALTQRRKKWRSVDLRKNSPIEQRLEAALAERTELAFTDTPLTDAIDFLEDVHGISIIIDNAALQDEGVDPSSPVNLELSGITLRSALKLMLGPLLLTYVIEDEVMKITTQAKADEVLSTRVYPVADLVVPIQSAGGGAGQGQGIFGNPFGGGGQGGGGQGGGGFGGGGGGFGGGGGGFPSVAPEPLIEQPAAPKKKLP